MLKKIIFDSLIDIVPFALTHLVIPSFMFQGVPKIFTLKGKKVVF